MDEQQSTSASSNSSSGGSKKWIMIAAIVAIIIIVAAVGGYFFMNQSSSTTETANTTPDGQVEGENQEITNPTAAPSKSTYKDGTYTATGTYSYHAGKESVEVTATIDSGKITKIDVVSLAKAPTSKVMQADFIANFKPMVVGKNIDDVKLGKVSGSSLTGIGFNAALEDIKTQASES